MTLTEFLLARIAEDEAAARVAGAWLRAPDGHNDDVLWSVADGQAEPFLAQYAVGRHFDHIAHHDPARVLAECEAKRQLIERVGNPNWAGFNILALPYADHPDYQQEWKP